MAAAYAARRRSSWKAKGVNIEFVMPTPTVLELDVLGMAKVCTQCGPVVRPTGFTPDQAQV